VCADTRRTRPDDPFDQKAIDLLRRFVIGLAAIVVVVKAAKA
jgi:hypothetical protein